MNERDALVERDTLVVLDTPAERAAPADEVPDGGVRDSQTQDEARGAALSLTEAALATGRHRSTLRRYLRAERFPNADFGADGAWRIPIEDLLSADLLPHPAQADPHGPLAGLETAVERLRAQNGELRRRVAVSEALANERAERIEDLRLLLRTLPPTNSPETNAEAPEPAISHFVWSGEITGADPVQPYQP